MSETKTMEAFNRHFDLYRKEIMDELVFANDCEDYTKDIIIVVHNQLPYFQSCIESIVANTTKYHLYIWDNASNEETQDYLNTLMRDHFSEIDIMRSDENIGFIKPNNELVKWGNSEYIILLNSDTKVHEGWDKGMVGFLRANPQIAQVGYLGGVLNGDGLGVGMGFGSKIDYIPGWCFCISRETHKRFGLFNEADLSFAYCEDADFSLRLRESGMDIYSLHTLLVHHHENKTINVVKTEGQVDVQKTFDRNHEYMRSRWNGYLKDHSVLAKERLNADS